VQDAGSGAGYDAAAGIGRQVARHMREEGGVITRFVGDQIVLAPPLIVNAQEVDTIVGAVEAAVRAVTDN
jgi:adenosylmethionine-8-amino-7-oxononanoate aminotransferase